MKKRTFQIIKIIIAMSAYSYIAWKIYDNNKLFSDGFITNYHLNTQKILLLSSVFLLMPLNWLIEAIKWTKLVENFTQISLKHSVKAVLAGISTGIFTPNRIGEFAGRSYITNKSKIVSGVFAGFASGLAQSLITVLMGVIALNLYLFMSENVFFVTKYSYWAIFIFSFLLSLTIFFLFFHLHFLTGLKKYFPILKKYSEELIFLKTYTNNTLLKVLIFSFLRYFIFFLQFFILLSIFNVEISLDKAFIAIALIYLFLFAIPSFALSEMGIRGSLAVFFIGMYSSNYSGILLAAVLLWVINLAIPAVLGTLILFKAKL